MNAEVISGISRITKKRCITSLYQCLAKEGIIAFPSGDIDISDKPRGVVYLLRYIPEETVFELQPGFPKYFQISRRYDLLSHEDADSLVYRLAALGCSMRDRYQGRLIKQFQTGAIGEFLDSAPDAQSLGLLEATEDWFPDLLHEQFRWPCIIDEYLMASDFSELSLDVSAISQIAGNPIRALIAGLGIVRTGHWLGLSTSDITATLELLSAGSGEGSVVGINLPIKRYAEKIVIPIFSAGFQGSIIGCFSNLEPRQKMRLRCILDQVGHCLGELYALERKSQLLGLLRHTHISAKVLAEAVIRIASPVEHIVVSCEGAYHAHVICKEEDYLAGYEQKTGPEAEQLTHDASNELLDVPGLDPPAQIYVKALHGYAALDPVIHALRIKTALSEFLLAFMSATTIGTPSSRPSGVGTLNISELEQMIVALQQQMYALHGRRAAAKLLCFFEIVKDEFGLREIRLTNAEMQRRMSSKLGASKINGYQVTGEALKKFSLEIDDLLPNRFLFEHLNDKVTRVRWH